MEALGQSVISLFIALNTAWNISRVYSRDDAMLALLMRIINVLVKRASSYLELAAFFQ